MSTIETTIVTDRECDHCGYNLKGLSPGGKCPECGKPIRGRSSKTSGFMSDEAPTRFVRVLRLGFTTTSLALLLALAGVFVGVLGPLVHIVAALLWAGGIYIITLPRPGRGEIRPDKVLDNERLRLIIRLLNLVWPAVALVSGVLLMAQGIGGFVVSSLTVLRGLLFIVAWVSMIPTSIYLAELAYWSSNDSLASRMRGAAWILAVVGTINALVTGTGILTGNGVLKFIGIFPSIILFATVVVYAFTFIQMMGVMKWVINHQELTAGSYERKEQRRKQQERYRGRIVDDIYCEECGYNLIGLEPGGKCPECGTPFAHPAGYVLRDPATTPSYHDNTPIEIDEWGENKGVYFNDQLDAGGKPKIGGVPYTPAVEVPDEGAIPLSKGDEEPEEKSASEHAPESGEDDPDRPRTPENTGAREDDSRDLDGPESISLA